MDLKVKLSPNLKSAINNTGWVFGDQIVRLGIGLIVGVWIARYLGSNEYGLLSYSMAFVALFSPLTTLGLDSLLVRDVLHEPHKRNEILGTVLGIRCVGGLIGAILTILSIVAINQHNDRVVLLVVILSVGSIFQASNTIDLWFQSQLESKHTVVAKMCVFSAITLIRLALIYYKVGIVPFAIVNSLEMALGCVALSIAYCRSGASLIALRWNSQLVYPMLKESFPLLLSGLTIMLYMKIDLIMIGQMIGTRSVGIYAAASRLSEVWYALPVAIAASAAPSIYEGKKISEEVYYGRVKKLIGTMTWLAIIIVLPMTLASDYFVTTLFGIEYKEAGSILAIHIWSSIFVFTGVATSSWFVAEGLSYLSLQRTAIGAIVNVILNLILIPKFHGLGAAIATVISQAFASLFCNAFHPKTRKIFYLQLRSALPSLKPLTR